MKNTLVGIPSPNPSFPQSVKVVTGDNQVVVRKNYITNSEIEQGNYGSVDGQPQSADNRVRTKEYNIVEAEKQYILSSNSNVQVLAFYYQENNTFISSTPNWNNLPYTLTTPENCAKVKVSFRYSNNSNIVPSDVTNVILTTQAETQSTTLHLGSLELCKIGDYQDVITGTKDNWKVVRKVGKVRIIGNVDGVTARTNTVRFLIRNLMTNNPTSDFYNVLCTHLIGQNVWSNDIQGIFIGWDATNLIGYSVLSIDKNICGTTTSSIENYLSSENIYLYYPIRAGQETETPITDTSLVQSLNELNDLMSYDGTTNITITSDDSNAQMIAQVSALKGE